MKRYTKKQLRELVAIGAARDLDKAHDDFVKAGGYSSKTESGRRCW